MFNLLSTIFMLSCPSFVRSFGAIHSGSRTFNRMTIISSTVQYSVSATNDNLDGQEAIEENKIDEPSYKKNRLGKNNKNRFRQHVNPLARKFQEPAQLGPGSSNYLLDAFSDATKPLHLDVGCGKGGFILEVAENDVSKEKNYLGLEIRPSVVEFALNRLNRYSHLAGSLYYVSCNANVDLERILGQYTGQVGANGNASQSIEGGVISLVSIQFPDPHFKKSHEKRRVVNSLFVDTLAKYMVDGSVIFLQSDVKPVLDYMREKFRESKYFTDDLESVNHYLDENPIGIKTEREISVLNRNLEVWRITLRRNSILYEN